MNERIKELRKSLGLTMEKFGERLGVKKNTISQYESGVNGISDQVLKSICREFNVSEKWLRDGEGEMYVPQTRNQEIQAFINNVMADEDEAFKKRFVSALSKARPEFWDELEKFIDAIEKD